MVKQLNKVLVGRSLGNPAPTLTICSLRPIIPRDQPLWLRCVAPMFVMLMMVRWRKWGSYYDNDKKRVFGSKTPSPPHSRCSLCLGFPGGPSTNTFTRYFSSYETVWIKLTNVYLSFGHKKYWVKYPPVTKNYSIVETACDHGRGGESALCVSLKP